MHHRPPPLPLPQPTHPHTPAVEVDAGVVQELLVVEAGQVQVGELHRAQAALTGHPALEALQRRCSEAGQQGRDRGRVGQGKQVVSGNGRRGLQARQGRAGQG